jgi:GTP-binding protein HflX
MRGVELYTGTRVILSDTVGFISDLPTQLVAAFRATLEEVLEADLILHVRDISHPETEEQAEDVEAILRDLGVAEETPRLELWNKVDRLPAEAREVAATLAARRGDVLVMSAATGEGVPDVVAAITETLDGVREEARLHLPFVEGRQRAWLHDNRVVTDERQEEEGWRISVRWTPRQRDAFRRL